MNYDMDIQRLKRLFIKYTQECEGVDIQITKRSDIELKHLPYDLIAAFSYTEDGSADPIAVRTLFREMRFIAVTTENGDSELRKLRAYLEKQFAETDDWIRYRITEGTYMFIRKIIYGNLQACLGDDPFENTEMSWIDILFAYHLARTEMTEKDPLILQEALGTAADLYREPENDAGKYELMKAVDVMSLLQSAGASDDLLAAALLHTAYRKKQLTNIYIMNRFSKTASEILSFISGPNAVYSKEQTHLIAYLPRDVKKLITAEKIIELRHLGEQARFNTEIWDRLPGSREALSEYYYEVLDQVFSLNDDPAGRELFRMFYDQYIDIFVRYFLYLDRESSARSYIIAKADHGLIYQYLNENGCWEADPDVPELETLQEINSTVAHSITNYWERQSFLETQLH